MSISFYKWEAGLDSSDVDFSGWIEAQGGEYRTIAFGKDIVLNANTVVPSNIDIIDFYNNSKFTGNYTLTINKMSATPRHKIFDSNVNVIFNPGSVSFICPEWFGSGNGNISFGNVKVPVSRVYADGIAIGDNLSTNSGELFVNNKIGIGTNTPSNSLDVNGTMRVRNIGDLGIVASKYLTINSSGILKYRTALDMLLDLGISGLVMSGTITDHGLLSGLLHDDHPQYILSDGTRDLTGPINGATPTATGHLSNKYYVDLVSGSLNTYITNVSGISRSYTDTASGTLNTYITNVSGDLNNRAITGFGTSGYIVKYASASGLQNSLIYDNGSGLGIGTTSPLQKVQINDGSIFVRSDLSGTVRGVSIATGGQSVWWISPLATSGTNAGNLNISTGGTPNVSNFMTILNTGKVGINNTSPSEALHVSGTGIFTGNVGINNTTPQGKLDIYYTGYFDANATPSGNDSIALYGAKANNSGKYYGGISWITDGSRKRAAISSVAERSDTDFLGLAFFTQGNDGVGPMAESVRISHSGNVGIGTTDPIAKLTVVGNNSGVYLPGLLINNNNTTIGSEVGVDFNVSTSLSTIGLNARVSAVRTGAGPSGDLVFSTANNGTVTEKMRITSTGNIGIGTSTPSGTLQIGTSVALNSDRNSFVSGLVPSVIYRSTDTGSSYPFQTAGNLIIQSRSSADRDIAFVNGLIPTVVAVITATGNLGIGTTSPNAKLHVIGSGVFTNVVHGVTPTTSSHLTTKQYVDNISGTLNTYISNTSGQLDTRIAATSGDLANHNHGGGQSGFLSKYTNTYRFGNSLIFENQYGPSITNAVTVYPLNSDQLFAIRKDNGYGMFAINNNADILLSGKLAIGETNNQLLTYALSARRNSNDEYTARIVNNHGGTNACSSLIIENGIKGLWLGTIGSGYTAGNYKGGFLSTNHNDGLNLQSTTSSGKICFTTDFTEKMRIHTSGVIIDNASDGLVVSSAIRSNNSFKLYESSTLIGTTSYDANNFLIDTSRDSIKFINSGSKMKFDNFGRLAVGYTGVLTDSLHLKSAWAPSIKLENTELGGSNIGLIKFYGTDETNNNRECFTIKTLNTTSPNILENFNPRVDFMLYDYNLGADSCLTKMSILNNGNVGIGTTNPVGKLDLTNEGTSNSTNLVLHTHGSALNQTNGINSYKSYGTAISPSAIPSGSQITNFQGYAYDGTSYEFAGGFNIVSSKNWNTTNHATSIIFYTNNNGGTSNSHERMRIHENGFIGINTANPKNLLTIDMSVVEYTGILINGAYDTPRLVLQKQNDPDNLAGLGMGLGGNFYEHSVYFPRGPMNNGCLTIGSYSGVTYSTKMLISESGNVGINTTAPTAKLYVNGGIKTTELEFSGNQINLQSSASNNSISINYSGKSNIYLDMYKGNGGSSTIRLHPTGISYLNGGSVGIGTTGPVETLHINTGASQAGIRLTNSSTNINSGLGLQMDTGLSAYLWNYNSGNMYIGTNNGTAMFIDKATRNVGIGETTPTAKLHASFSNNDTNWGNSLAGGLTIQNTNTTLNNWDILSFAGVNSGGGYEFLAGISAQKIGHTTTQAYGDLVFHTQDSTSIAERMRLTNSGRLGIGDSAPGNKLVVSEPTAINCSQAIIARSGNSLRSELYFGTKNSGGTDIGACLGSNGALGGGLALKGSTVGTTTPDMFIDAAGNVGIGTTSPKQKLDVVGKIISSGLIVSGLVSGTDAIHTLYVSGNFTTGGAIFRSYGETKFYTAHYGTGDGIEALHLTAEGDLNAPIAISSPRVVASEYLSGPGFVCDTDTIGFFGATPSGQAAAITGTDSQKIAKIIQVLKNFGLTL